MQQAVSFKPFAERSVTVLSIALKKVELYKIRSIYITTFIFLFSLMSSLQLFDFIHEEAEEVEQFIVFMDRVFSEGESFGESLTKLPLTSCNYEHRGQLTNALLGQEYIQDIVFKTPSNKMCSATGLIYDRDLLINVSESPLTLDEIDQSTIVDLDFNHFVVRYGSYSLYYSIDFSDIFLIEPRRYETLNLERTTGKNISYVVRHLSKLGELYSPYIESNSYHIKECSEKFNFCVAFLLTNEEIFIELYWNALGLIGLSLIAAYIASIVATKHYKAKRSVVERVREGLLNKRFYPLFQPIIDVNSQQVIGCEMLARFTDEYGSLSPVDFIPEVSAQGATWEFTESLLEQTIRLLETNSEFDENFRISFNVFAQDVANNNISKLIKMPSLNHHKFNWVMEITEDKFLETSKAQEHLANLSSSKIKVAIDDFGTGYSNLQHLKLLYCHYLKIDRSFIIDLEEDTLRTSLVSSIVNIAEKAKLDVVAEGVETIEQFNSLKLMNVKFAQGWLFGRPMNIDELAKLTKNTKQDDTSFII